MDVNDDFMSAYIRETNAVIEEIDMAGLQSAQDEARFELSPPSIQLQLEIEEKESFFKSFMEHNNVNLDSDSLKILLLDVYKDFKGDWYLKDSLVLKRSKLAVQRSSRYNLLLSKRYGLEIHFNNKLSRNTPQKQM